MSAKKNIYLSLLFVFLGLCSPLVSEEVNNSKKDTRNIELDYLQKLLEGDLVFVGEISLSTITQIVEEITTPFVSAFSAYGVYEAINN